VNTITYTFRSAVKILFRENLLKLLIIKLCKDSAYEYKLLIYKIRKNYGSDTRVNHQITKFIKKVKKEIFCFKSTDQKEIKNILNYYMKLSVKNIVK